MSPAGQVVITHGGVYTLTVGQRDPNQAAVEIQTTEHVKLERCTIYATGTTVRAVAGNASLTPGPVHYFSDVAMGRLGCPHSWCGVLLSA
jgi:hypothetical protein